MAIARLNVAEILTDRGEHTEAESTLQKTLPVWKSSEYRYFQGACHWMLGRVSLRGNRIDEALARLEAGTYGFCERCGEPIDFARLKALPSASLCIRCQVRAEQ